MEYYYDSQGYFLWSVYLCWYREKLYFLSHLRVMKQNEKEMVPQEEDTGYDLKQYTECRAVDTMVASADTQL